MKMMKKIIILYKKDWHEGVIGIIAGKIKDKLNKPVIVLCENEPGICKGSARSVYGFSIGDMLIKAKEEAICINGGGHKMAAGMTIMEDKIDDFKQFAQDYTRDLRISTTKTINIDCIMDAGGFDKNFLGRDRAAGTIWRRECPAHNFNHGSINNKRANIWSKMCKADNQKSRRF